jgi:8-oxo-dGTP pyrophosphatase MutT (NUDIX family)
MTVMIEIGKSSRWLFRQAGVIPYRLREDDVEILLITSRSRKRWIIPKGLVEPDLTPAESAVQEAWEEAGLAGQVSKRSLGQYEYEKWGGVCRVEVFLLRVEKLFTYWPEANFRDREWVTIEEAARRVDEGGLKEIIRGLAEELPGSFE